MSDSEPRDDRSASVHLAARRLADAGLLSKQQARAYVLRDVEEVPRQEAADRMGIEDTTLDSHRTAAKNKLKAASETADVLDELTDADDSAE